MGGGGCREGPPESKAPRASHSSLLLLLLLLPLRQLLTPQLEVELELLLVLLLGGEAPKECGSSPSGGALPPLTSPSSRPSPSPPACGERVERAFRALHSENQNCWITDCCRL